MENRIKVKIKQCYDTEENYITNNPVLLAGQLAYTEDRYGEYKIGDGTHAWNELEYVKNYFIGTKAEYTEANNKGLIRPGMIICITDDNDYCNIPVDDEMDETSEHVVLNNTITKYVNTHDLKDNRLASSKCTFDGGIPFAGAKSVSGSLGDFLTESRSGFYTVVMKDSNNTWYNVISSRHRNGADDGNKYGLMIMNAFSENADLVWDKQTANGWQGQRTILDSANYPNLISRTNNQFYAAKGLYTAKLEGTAGTQGFIKFATIKIKSAYANYPCVFIISGRGRALPLIVSVHFQSANNNTPALLSLTQTGDASYYVYIHNEGNGVWSLYAGKNEAWGRVDILNEYYSDDHFEITHPGTQTASLPSGYVAASVGGLAGFANAVRDAQSNTTITFSYNKAGMNYGEYTWLAGWNGYELRAVNKNQYMGEVSANGYWGLAPNGDATQWVRTTNQGIIPYQQGNRGGGHQYLGTSTWYFAQSYIDHMYAVDIDLTKGIKSPVSTGTHLKGAQGTDVIINCTAASNGYNMLCKMPSPGGAFNIGTYMNAMHLYYIGNSKINANQNGYDKDLILMNESGNSLFPGSVSISGDLTVSGILKNAVFNTSLKVSSNANPYIMLNTTTDNKVSYVEAYTRVPHGFDDGFNNLVFAINNDSLNANSKHYLALTSDSNLYKIGSLYTYSHYNNRVYLMTQTKGGSVAIGGYNSNSTFFPCKDNWMNLGEGNVRWKQVYAINSSISTSDIRQKKEISYIGKDSEYDTQMSDEKLIYFFTHLSPVVYKRTNGDTFRPHHGLIAQDVEKLLKELNTDHAAFIKSPVTETIEEKSINKETGEEIINSVEKIIEGKYNYGLRYEEFIGDNIRFSQITYGEVQELKEENTMLKEKLAALEEKVSLLFNNL